jgi:hypothetical protein
MWQSCYRTIIIVVAVIVVVVIIIIIIIVYAYWTAIVTAPFWIAETMWQLILWSEKIFFIRNCIMITITSFNKKTLILRGSKAQQICFEKMKWLQWYCQENWLVNFFFNLQLQETILNLNTKFKVFHVELKTSFGNITSNKTLGFWKMVKLFMDGSDWSTLPQAEANGDQKYVLHAQTNPSPNLALPRRTQLQPDRSLLDRRKTLFWRHRCYGMEGCKCKHRIRPLASRKLRARIWRASNTKPQQLRRFAVDRLKDRAVASWYYDELEYELQGVQAQQLSLDEKCKKLEETIQKVATNTITRKQANKEWLYSGLS